MRLPCSLLCCVLPVALLPGAPPPTDRAAEGGWVALTGDKWASAWKGAPGGWEAVADVSLDAKNPRKLAPKPGKGALYNGPKGRVRDLVTKESYADLEVELEFMIPKGSNSGVKLQGLYEIQIV